MVKKKGDSRGLLEHRVRDHICDYMLGVALAKDDHAWAERLRALPLFRVAQHGRKAVFPK